MMDASSTLTETSTPPPPLRLTALVEADIPRLRLLQEDWFPVRYPAEWYDEAVDARRAFAVAARSPVDGRLHGVVTASLTRRHAVRLVRDEWIRRALGRVRVCYIMSLGVAAEFRRTGVATGACGGAVPVGAVLTHRMLWGFCVLTHTFGALSLCLCVFRSSLPALSLSRHCAYRCSAMLEEIISQLGPTVECIYLHVLATNSRAVDFYRANGFETVKREIGYYGSLRDGDALVMQRLLNGGRRARSVWDALRSVAQLCMPRRAGRRRDSDADSGALLPQ